MSRPRLVIITPCRDEAAFAARTLESVAAQSLRPDRWIIVDDGSSDGTGEILRRFAEPHPWIEIVQRQDRGRRAVGGGVVEAFYAGYALADPAAEFICKLDLDLDLPPRYFENLLGRMAADPRLGTCSGKPWFRDPVRGRLVSEACGDETSVGMTKLYRHACFRAIGGFVREVMWDAIDCHRCRMLGWKARSWDEPDLRFLHLRPMGSSQTSWWSGRTRHGRGQWFMGTDPLYMAASATFRMSRPPLLAGGVGMLWGYLSAGLAQAPRLEDAGLRRFIVRWQRRALVVGKARATREFEEAGAAVWSPHA